MKIININALINKKQHGKSLNEKEIQWFMNAVLNKTVTDYQISAFLMAVWFKGMSAHELYLFTKGMLNTGSIVSFNHHGKISIDKHSTGGVGDKVSLVLIPILTALGYSVAKLSGRGLGFTGGTIDKIESVGASAAFSQTEAQRFLDANDCFVIEQSQDIAPIDKVLYALRDTTSTVDSLPLIASSVMSKKLALKNDYIFIDLKYGKGAFCKSKKTAQILAKHMYEIAKRFKRKLYIKFSSMNRPLGKAIGNAIEMLEAVNFLTQKWDQVGQDFIDLIEELVCTILLETKRAVNKKAALEQYRAVLDTNQPYQRFLKFIELQGGNSAVFEDSKLFFNPQYKAQILAPRAGVVHYSSPIDLAMIGVNLGAGRKVKTDKIDPMAGLFLLKQTNEKVQINEPVLELYSSKPITDIEIANAQKTVIIK